MTTIPHSSARRSALLRHSPPIYSASPLATADLIFFFFTATCLLYFATRRCRSGLLILHHRRSALLRRSTPLIWSSFSLVGLLLLCDHRSTPLHRRFALL
ncbi:hypothetical protein Ddye_020549 [Dipteronia dyeriana]|uniref:Uncharacterized protein n=1 Tax=Dipteronia dyeriana TaxID=168575 RepID=A0AAD9TZX2_9ROSI|nr:hypothetical protein Ddye_020549 [Dipteronia dyeriana]